MAIIFPGELLRPQSIKPRLVGHSVGGGATLVGPEQTAELSAGGFWVMDYDLGARANAQRLKLLRALLMKMELGAAEVVMPIVDEPQAPWPDSGRGDLLTTFSDGTAFSDGALFAQSRIVFELASGLSENGGEVALTRVAGADLQGGEFVTFLHPTAGPRAYCIANVEKTGTDAFSIGFGPPAREPVAVGDAADFARPRCVMRLVPGQGEAWPTITTGWKAASSLKLVESFDYLAEED